MNLSPDARVPNNEPRGPAQAPSLLPYGRRAVASLPSNGFGEGRTRATAGDRGLVARASRGDVAAFSKLVQAHSGMVYRVALRMLGTQDAQDASQEVWIRVWRNIKNFRGESAFSTWLYKIAVHACLSILRKKQTQEAREFGEDTPYPPESSGGDADPEAAALSAERRGEIQAALHHVRAEHRAALVLRYMEGLSYAEIAEVLGVPVGTAKGWASRGRAAMLVVLTKKIDAPRTSTSSST